MLHSYSPIVRSVVLKRRNRTTLKLLGNVFIHIAARSRLSLQMVERIQTFNNRCHYSEFYTQWRPSDDKMDIVGLLDMILFVITQRGTLLQHQRHITVIPVIRSNDFDILNFTKNTKIVVQNWSNGDSNQGHLFYRYSSTPLDQEDQDYRIKRIIHVYKISHIYSCNFIGCPAGEIIITQQGITASSFRHSSHN